MKKFICIILALLTLAILLTSCASKEKDAVIEDAIVDYYENRMGNEMPEKCIKYVGEDSETGYFEYRIENDDEDISETLFVEVQGIAYIIRNEEGIRIHIYNGLRSEEQ